MGNIAEELIHEQMFGCDGNQHEFHRHKSKRTPSEQKIASIRKEIAINISNGMCVQEARKQANQKYGKGWRERGLTSDPTDQWSEEDLATFK